MKIFQLGFDGKLPKNIGYIVKRSDSFETAIKPARIEPNGDAVYQIKAHTAEEMVSILSLLRSDKANIDEVNDFIESARTNNWRPKEL